MNRALAASSGEPPIPRTPWRLILIIGTAYGVLTSAQVRASSTLGGRAIPWLQAFGLQMPMAAAWILAAPGILWLGRRYPLPSRDWPRNVAIHLLASLSFVFLLYLGAAWLTPLVLGQTPGQPLPTRALRQFVVWVIGDGLIYWSILAVAWAVEHNRRLRERELFAAQLEAQLAQADLHALRSQLHPHFLFNALHTIGSLVRTGDRDTAVQVTADLGDLLRRMLEGATRHEVPLKQELDFIKSYLAIERVRFRDRLQVAFDVDPGLEDAKVPYLILQPLVENAIRHGIAPHLFAGKLSVTARALNGRLQLVVRDDGPGASEDDGARPGIGLSNTRARLARLYGRDFELEVGNLPEGGMQARIELPFQLAPAEWDGRA